ncbi:hypothetical protein AAKU52_001850 [Pedobacter sp. CG_S7]
MKIRPNKRNEQQVAKEKKKIEEITYKIAIFISAISTYFFFIKLLLL